MTEIDNNLMEQQIERLQDENSELLNQVRERKNAST
jgi:hypothetical protein